MAIDPGKLEAFANDEGGKGGGKGGGGKQKGGDHDGDGGDGGHDESHDEGGGENEEKDEGEGKFAKLTALLEEFAEDVEAAADSVDAEALHDPESEMSPEDEKIFEEDVDGLDEGLKKELAATGGMSLDEAHEIASHLEGEDMIEDGDRVAGWLFRAANHLHQG